MKPFYPLLAIIGLIAFCNLELIAADGQITNKTQVAGDYYFGDGLGVNCVLKLSAKGKFSFEWQGCMGTYDKNNGNFAVETGVLKLSPKKPNIQKGFRGTPTNFFLVRWSDRLYLVPTNNIIGFCNAVNQGDEPRLLSRGFYYLRKDDWKKTAPGKPDVPAEWTKYLLSSPARGKIIEIMGNQEAWIDIGSENGLLEGMILTAQDDGKLLFSQLRILSVEKNKSRVKCEWSESQIKIGQKVSSLFFDRKS